MLIEETVQAVMPASIEDPYPTPSREALRKVFVGRQLSDVPTPAAILDRAVIRRNCQQMREACKALGVDFRPHVKTTKTTEVALLQLGEAAEEAKIVVSTVAEAEHLSECLHDFHKRGKSVNVIYGMPLPPSQVQRLADLRNKVGPYSVSVLIDNVSQLEQVDVFKHTTGTPLQVVIKVDTGYHRAGVDYKGAAFEHLIQEIKLLQDKGLAILVGFYSHAGHSYEGDSSVGAIKLLITEIEGLDKAAKHATNILHRIEKASKVSGLFYADDPQPYSQPHSQPRYLLSVGATPTATSIENIVSDNEQDSSGPGKELKARVRSLIADVKKRSTLELHAGVYPILDMQQLATHASPSPSQQALITTSDVALTVLAEVVSLYDERSSPEALIAAGSLALGREPCKAYPGWGIVSDWGWDEAGRAEHRSGWQVGRISQEHGILTKDEKNTDSGSALPLKVGQKLRIWTNHACIAGAGYGWYFIVDSSLPKDRRDEIVDIWVRWRGW